MDKDFETPEHERAWFVRVTVNQCKDFLKNFFRSKTVPLDILEDIPALSREKTDVLKTVLSLPEKYREVIYLFYYEDYQAKEIGKILGKNTNTIFTLLKRGPPPGAVLRKIQGSYAAQKKLSRNTTGKFQEHSHERHSQDVGKLR